MYKQTDDAQWKAILVPCAIQGNITEQIQTNKQTNKQPQYKIHPKEMKLILFHN